MTVETIYDELAAGYDNHFQRSIDVAENKTVIHYLSRLPGVRDGFVLDLGCGTGFVLDHLPLANYTGLDVSGEMLSRARVKHPQAAFMSGDMADLSMFGDQSFSHVISTFGSFSYSLRPERVAEEIYRVLQPGGYFFIQPLGWRYRFRKHHISNGKLNFIGYNETILRGLFAPFRDVQITGVNLSGIAPLTLVESKLLGPVVPSLFMFQIVTGRK